MMIEIDFSSDEAIYIQLTNQIIMGIATSRLQEGDTLPSVRQLADTVGINMHTVNKSYALLKEDGYVRMDRRKGAVISFSLDDSNRKFIRNMEKDMELMVAQCINRGISEEEAKKNIEELFKKFNS